MSDAIHPTHTPFDPAALLARLQATHGPDVLAALLGAGLAQDAQANDDCDPIDPTDWLLGFLTHAPFVAAAGDAMLD